MRAIKVRGVSIDLDHKDVKKLKTPAEVAKAGFFDHLDDDDRAEASKELLAEINKPAEKEKSEKPETKPLTT